MTLILRDMQMLLLTNIQKWKKLVAVVGALMALPLTPTNVTAKDLGVYGKTYPITEQDFLLYLMAKIADLKASGKWADIERQMQETTQKEALNPLILTFVTSSLGFNLIFTLSHPSISNSGSTLTSSALATIISS